ncbi:MAG: alpha-amylase family glycosyl hydrolase [Candidatus Saccharibacteria bacterium]
MEKHGKKNVGAIVRKSNVSFRVWAPFANSVSVTGSFNNWSETPLVSENDGYWFGEINDAKAGQEYKYIIKNGKNTYYRNDPRALHFTTSAGCSVIASTTFDWEDDSFNPIPFNQQIIYELHVGTFYRPDPADNGTFQDVIDKLDYLSDLGINMIELMPISSMSMDRGWGYAIDYIFAVESLYGGRHGLMELVRAAHKKGIGVVLDVVYNHFGPDESLDLWQFDGWSQDGKGGIYFYNDWRAETPWGNTRPDFGRSEVRQYILDNVRMWMQDCHVDGLRVDSTIFIRNVNGHNDDPSTDLPDGWALLQQINSLAKKINPSAITIAEDIGGNEYITKPQNEGGAGFSSQWAVGFPQVLRDALYTNNPDNINLTGICASLNQRFNNNSFQRIIYSDSHDSSANGSARLNEVIAPGKSNGTFARKQSLIAAAILMTYPGIPMLFQGQEFMEGGSFNDWQGLSWENSVRYKNITLAYNHLISLRKNIHGNSAGLMGESVNLIHMDEYNKVLAYHRWQNGGAKDDVIIIINFGDKLHERYVMDLPRIGTWNVRFNSNWNGYSQDFKNIDVPENVTTESGGAVFVLPPESALIFSQDT